MDPTLKVAVLLLFVLLGFANASFVKPDFDRCERVVRKWASAAINQEPKDEKHKLQDLLFFLHIPRTGGRTYFHCFLRKLYSSYDECPRSYDKLRFDPRKANCKLLVTHDDYSIMSKLPSLKTSMVTILRNPIDRVFSTYEFSIEVGARFLVHDNLTSATQMAVRLRSKNKGVSTLDIWPWKYLVPWMREDLFARRDARRLRGIERSWSSDSYNMKDVAMPLHEYINDPVAHDIVHNGATFQVVGLTNSSYLPEAHDIRHCVQHHKVLGEHVLQVAKKRLDDMLYVGLTEDHRESAKMFANIVGAQVLSHLGSSNSSADGQSNNVSEHSSSLSDAEPDDTDNQSLQNGTSNQKAIDTSSNQNAENAEALRGNMSVGKLMEGYETCIKNLRKAQSTRRTNSLKRISPVNFSKEARLRVSEEVLQQIRSLNNLDLELYKYAQDIYTKQRQNMDENFVTTESWEMFLKSSYGLTLWSVILYATSVIFLLLLLLVYVNARRRRSKIKI